MRRRIDLRASIQSSWSWLSDRGDGSSDPALYAGGFFSEAGGQSVDGIARWDETEWSSVGGGMNMSVTALTATDIGDGPIPRCTTATGGSLG